MKILILINLFIFNTLAFSSELDARMVVAQYETPGAFSTTREVVVKESVPGTYFAVVGFDMGYFGLQEKGNGQKCFIFSVWDSGTGDDSTQTPADQRATLLKLGKDATSARFGNEGTGVQIFYNYDWVAVKESYRFILSANVFGDETTFDAYVYVPSLNQRIFMGSIKTKTNGKLIENSYSFVEDFLRDGQSKLKKRSAYFREISSIIYTGDSFQSKKVYFSAAAPHSSQAINLEVFPYNWFLLETGGDTKLSTELFSIIDLK